MKRQNAGVWVGGIVVLFALVIFVQSFSLKYYTKFGPGPGLFPIWLSGILLLIGGAYIWHSLKKEVITWADILPKGREMGNVLSVILAVVIFMVIVNVTGFIIASTVLLFILLRREYKWYTGLGISSGVSIVLFLVFKSFFTIPLPVNMFGW
ncbi:MAG: tripartite tricarboxylate transporter family receptor [Brevibacillus sp.]|nr:tripartite tricarboxylate transporter family receptor [Brevibacillus sp.]